jgi:hypothetical protein
MEFTQHASLDAPIGQIDLERWLFTLTDAEYQAAARGHLGAGTFVEHGVRGSINVESIGGTLMIQHYRQVSASPDRVELLSKRTRGYVFHVIPVRFQVRWTLTATPGPDETTTFSCAVEVTMSPLIRFAARLIATAFFLRRHVDEETQGFAADITRKLARPIVRRAAAM